MSSAYNLKALLAIESRPNHENGLDPGDNLEKLGPRLDRPFWSLGPRYFWQSTVWYGMKINQVKTKE